MARTVGFDRRSRDSGARGFAHKVPLRERLFVQNIDFLCSRRRRDVGHEVRLMPAQYVKAYIKRNKHDAADGEAICEAVQRQTMRFVPVKTAEPSCRRAPHLLHQCDITAAAAFSVD